MKKLKTLTFKGNIKEIHFPIFQPMNNVDGSITLNPKREIENILKMFKPRKNIGVRFVYKYGSTFGEIVLVKLKPYRGRYPIEYPVIL